MSVISDIFNATVGSFIKDVGDTVRQFVTTDADRIKLEAILQQQAMDFTDKVLTHADTYEKELTERQKNDMESDSWLSKNIRPMTLIYLLGVFSLLAVSDGITYLHFDVKPAYVTMLQSFLEYALMFYFGGRSLEKIAGVVGSVVKK